MKRALAWLLLLIALALGGTGCGDTQYADAPEDDPTYESYEEESSDADYGDSYADDGAYENDSAYEEDDGEYEDEYYEEDAESDCDPSYPDVCIPADSYDVDCAEVDETDFTVDGDDPYGLDGDGDGVGCESYDDSYYDDSYDEPNEYESDEYGDLDCSDVSGPVYVPPDDPNGLDGDGDGVGCE
jgi:hypothetical protein